jgi:hypothetical protein
MLITPFRVFTPVTMEVIPFAESETHRPSGVVSLNPTCGQLWTCSLSGALYPNRLAAFSAGTPPASAKNRITFLAFAGALEGTFWECAGSGANKAQAIKAGSRLRKNIT